MTEYQMAKHVDILPWDRKFILVTTYFPQEYLMHELYEKNLCIVVFNVKGQYLGPHPTIPSIKRGEIDPNPNIIIVYWYLDLYCNRNQDILVWMHS